MFYQLTDRVGWCSAWDLNQLPSSTKAVLAVGGNVEDLPRENTPLAVPEKIPYLRVAWPDHEELPESYFDLVISTIGLIKTTNLTPLVVHCRAGQMRSPVIAVLAAHLLGEGSINSLLEKASALRPDIMHDPGQPMKKYCRSILDWAAKKLTPRP